MNEDKPWRCKGCRVILGRVKRNASREPVLYVLREPVENWHARPLDEVVLCEIKGAAKVHCGKCGAVRAWFPERGRREKIAPLFLAGNG